MKAHKGSESCYRSGCRLQPCRDAHAAKARADRAKHANIRAGVPSAKSNVVPLQRKQQSPTETPEVGPVELGIRAELDALGDRVPPGVQAQAIKQAQMVDDTDHRAACAANNRVLQSLMQPYRQGPPRKTKSGHKLAVVQAMSGRGRKAN